MFPRQTPLLRHVRLQPVPLERHVPPPDPATATCSSGRSRYCDMFPRQTPLLRHVRPQPVPLERHVPPPDPATATCSAPAGPARATCSPARPRYCDMFLRQIPLLRHVRPRQIPLERHVRPQPAPLERHVPPPDPATATCSAPAGPARATCSTPPDPARATCSPARPRCQETPTFTHLGDTYFCAPGMLVWGMASRFPRGSSLGPRVVSVRGAGPRRERSDRFGVRGRVGSGATGAAPAPEPKRALGREGV